MRIFSSYFEEFCLFLSFAVLDGVLEEGLTEKVTFE